MLYRLSHSAAPWQFHLTSLYDIFQCYIAIFESLGKVNYVAIGISLVCLLILILYEYQMKPTISKKCRFPVPVQFILVVVGTLVAWLMKLNSEHGLRVVGRVPTG